MGTRACCAYIHLQNSQDEFEVAAIILSVVENSYTNKSLQSIFQVLCFLGAVFFPISIV